jgi:bacterioferritin B
MSSTAPAFHARLNEQIGNEFAASQQYVAIAVYYEAEALPQLAAHFYRQALEERNHAMMIVQFLLDTDRDVAIPGCEAPRTQFADTTEPVAIALEQERKVTAQIGALTAAAREELDFQGEQFLQWFLKEQVEEVASMSTLLRVCERAGTNVLLVEDYLAREAVGAEDDPTAPPAAGGAL